MHTVNVLAQYIDFDERGVPDNFSVVTQLITHHATLVMFANPTSVKAKQFFKGNIPDSYHVQDLYAKEVILKNGNHLRRIAARCDKLAVTFMGAILVASILI